MRAVHAYIIDDFVKMPLRASIFTSLWNIIDKAKEGKMLYIIKAQRVSGMQRIKCPECGLPVAHVAIDKDSKITGLKFNCRRCKEFFSVTTE